MATTSATMSLSVSTRTWRCACRWFGFVVCRVKLECGTPLKSGWMLAVGCKGLGVRTFQLWG